MYRSVISIESIDPNQQISCHRDIWFGVVAFLLIAGSHIPAQQIEEITVTAQKRSQDIREIPFGIGMLDEEEFQDALEGGADVLALAGRSPSLYVESSNGRLAPRFYIRGIGNVDFDVNASQPISLVLDEVVLENPTAKSFPLFDIERVEVLRGPQGTLFGRNTTAGIVKFDSFKPSERNETKFSVGAGRYRHQSFSGVINRPIGEDDARLRFSFLYNRLGDWIRNEAPGPTQGDLLGAFQDLAFRFQLAWSPSQSTDALLNVHGRRLSDATPTVFYGNAIKQGSSDLIDGFRRDRVSLDTQNIEQKANQVGVVLNIDHSSSSFNVISITGVHSILESLSRGDIDGGYGSVFAGVLPSGPAPGIPFDAQTADGIPSHLQLSQEIRLEGEVSTKKWVTGLYIFHEDFDIETFNYSTLDSPHTLNGYVLQNQKTQAWALFGSMDFLSYEHLTLTGGARLTSDSKDFEATRTRSPLAFLGIGPVGPIDASPSARVFTWDLSAIVDQSDNVTWFARAARSYRAPSIQGRLLFQDEISVGDEERGLSVESGFKSVLLERRMRFDTTVYRFAITDFQLTKIGGVANISSLVNAKEVNGYGLEVNLEYYVNAALIVDIGFSLNETSIDDPTLSVNGCGSATLFYGCTVTNSRLSNGEYLIHGTTLYNAPRLMWQASLRYDVPMPKGTLSFATDWIWHDDLRFTLYESLEFSNESKTDGGVRVTYTTRSTKHRISAYIRNLTNDVSLVGGIDFNNLTAMLNPQRTWGAEWELSL
ncbi:MAG: TonB-dependent receptor [Gammaproteobacteria bacterium]|nr:TonB-dependent receptor [Gammaproteobacteria bacterium]